MSNNRYIRQTLLTEIGPSGQEKLKNAHVVLIGCGGLGSIAAPYLAGAGVGKITLVDGDKPDISNLHRQVFYKTEIQNTTKAELLAKHITSLNPEIEVVAINDMLTKANIRSVVPNNSIVLECTDNIQTKYLVNDFCAIRNLCMIYGAIHKFVGYVSVFPNIADNSIHLRDVFPEPNDEIPTCSEVGVLGTIAGLIGLLQASEAIKYITGAGVTLIGELLTYDVLSNEQMKLKLSKNYQVDMLSLFNRNKYKSVTNCSIPEISLEVLLSNREDYILISILEDKDHIDIDSEVLHHPASSIDKVFYEDVALPVVYYCMTGKRSSVLLSQIVEEDSSAPVYSLKGGLKAWLAK